MPASIPIKRIQTWDDISAFDLHSYDYYIISFSGGKDSMSLLLYLIKNGVPFPKCEIWHQDIDGRGPTFFDWEVTPAYCKAVADTFGVKYYEQWKQGGFYREMMRENQLTAPTCFETVDGYIKIVGGTRGNPSTRLLFPQTSSDLKVRWCSSYLKINPCSTALSNQERFIGKRTLVLSG
ncbi:MAG: hypothetical protein LIO77_08470 [Rikenellaceae bacterium]|nr:hypothetical protein [Rikenellaceae bacterium]